jgi:predicted lipoprotein with Yx(FWY)xxD motif
MKRMSALRRAPTKLLLALGAVIAAAALLAACGGGSGSGAATAATPSANAKVVSVQQLGDAGRVLVDSNGKALYASDLEAKGTVMCTGACNSFWEPLTVSGGAPTNASVPGQLGTVKRPDGGMQLTYKGMPLYSFTQDGAGEVTGDGFKDAFDGKQFTWHVVAVGGSTGSSSTGSSSGSGSTGSTTPGYSY